MILPLIEMWLKQIQQEITRGINNLTLGQFGATF